jgi:hypothetical protein
MKKLLFCIFFLSITINAQLYKTIDLGKLQAYVYDHGCMSEDVRPCGNVYYYRGSYVTWDDITYNDAFEYPGGLLKDAGLFFGARNWTDTTGYTWDAYITGHCVRKRPYSNYQFAVPDEDDGYIHRYFRYPPTQIIVNGMHVEDPFPLAGDEVAPEKIWGTADIMVESNVRLSMGVDVKQRVLAWSQPGHDDYIIWDWTFVNTGNVNLDPEIELPGQILEDVYITRVTESFLNGTGNNKVMPTWAGTTEDHDTRLSYPQDDDSLRIHYVTPLRAGNAGYDSYGKKPSTAMNLLDGARFAGTAILFAPKSTNVPQVYPIANIASSNDPSQPSMHSSLLTEPSWIIWDFRYADSLRYREGYEVMVKGGFGVDSSDHFFQDVYYMDSIYDVYDTTASGAPTYYEQPLDRWGELDPSRGYTYAYDIHYLRFDQECHFSIGPYQMEFGDTLRYVYAYVGGAISRKTSYLLGEAWYNDREAASYGWLAGLDSAQMVEELRRRDPIFDIYYDESPGLSPTLHVNDIAKDLMVATGRDSLFNNGMNAQRNFNMNYNIPSSPAPPSVFEITSLPDTIELNWSYDAGFEPSDLAGFKIYRAEGSYVYEKEGEIIKGDWQCIDSAGPAERNYDDIEVVPGTHYYYAITAYNSQGVESGIYLTMMDYPAVSGIEDEEYSFGGMEISPLVFSKSLLVAYSLSRRVPVNLSMFDISGRCVQVFLSEESQDPGEHTMELKPSLPSGIYFLKIEAGEAMDCKKCVLLE